MRRKYIIFIICWLALSASLINAQNHEHQWIEAHTISGNFKAVAALPDVEIFTSPNTIMLKVNEQVEVRIYTILGKLVSAQELEPGLFSYHIDSHGIYIIKTEKTSCKVAV